ncbi:MAG: sigma-70 family RNA polymerase sigma factor [Verrucomicrobiota bacterium]
MNPSVEQLWSESSVRLGQFIRSRVTDLATAEDLLHDVFVKFQQGFDDFRDPVKVQGWLFLVARNTVIDHYRTRKKTAELMESLPADSSENAAEMEEMKTIFHRIFNGLPDLYRTPLVLTEFEGLTQHELAKRLNISLSGAKSRVQRARIQLKELLIDYCHREFGHAVGCQPCPYGLLPTVTAKKPVMDPRPVSRSNKSKV